MTIGQFALQERIYTTLNSDSNLTSTQGAAVYDEVPENASFPYVQIGRETSADYSTKDGIRSHHKHGRLVAIQGQQGGKEPHGQDSHTVA